MNYFISTIALKICALQGHYAVYTARFAMSLKSANLIYFAAEA